MPRPTVSVVVPTFRRSGFLDRALRSVLDQTFDAFEVIVVDDNGAGDPHRQRTLERLRPFVSDPRFHYLAHDENRGGSAARNTGIRAARAAYVAFLDDDDAWHPEKLAVQLETFRRSDSNVALVCTNYIEINEVDGTCTHVRPNLTEPLVPALLKKNVVGPTSTIMCRRDALVSVGGFDETLPSMQDLDLYVRLAERYRFVAIDRPLLNYHAHDSGNIGANLSHAAAARRIFAAKHRHGIETNPEVRRFRLEHDAIVFFNADQPSEAAAHLAARLRLDPFRIDLLALYLVAKFGLHREAIRARRILGACKRTLLRWVRGAHAGQTRSSLRDDRHGPGADAGTTSASLAEHETAPKPAAPNDTGVR